MNQYRKALSPLNLKK